MEDYQKSSIANFNHEYLLNILNQLKEKDEEIKELKSNFPFEIKKGEKLLSIIIMSQDESIIHSFICKNTDQFYKIENLFYEQYQNYAETENSFFLNGHKIKKT